MPTVTIYPITGRQLGPLGIPHRWCEEFDLTIRQVRRVVEELRREDVQVQVKPWFRHIFDAYGAAAGTPPSSRSTARSSLRVSFLTPRSCGSGWAQLHPGSSSCFADAHSS